MNLRRLQEPLLMIFRVVAIAFGGYGLISALCALAGMLLYMAGMPLSDAMLTTVLLGYLFYIALVMWGFADRSNCRRPLFILVSSVLAMALATLLAPSVLAT